MVTDACHAGVPEIEVRGAVLTRCLRAGQTPIAHEGTPRLSRVEPEIALDLDNVGLSYFQPGLVEWLARRPEKPPHLGGYRLRSEQGRNAQAGGRKRVWMPPV